MLMRTLIKLPCGYGGVTHWISVDDLNTNGTDTFPNLHFPVEEAKKFVPYIPTVVPPSLGPNVGKISDTSTSR